METALGVDASDGAKFCTTAPCMQLCAEPLCCIRRAAGICRHEAPDCGGSSELLHIKIKYIDTATSTSDKNDFAPTLHRVPKVRSNLHNLVRLATRKRTDRYINKPTQTTPSYPSTNKFKQGVFEFYEIANMSSEKAVNPKEKLEGTYQGRVQTHPSFLSFLSTRVDLHHKQLLINSTAQIKSADMVSSQKPLHNKLWVIDRTR